MEKKNKTKSKSESFTASNFRFMSETHDGNDQNQFCMSKITIYDTHRAIHRVRDIFGRLSVQYRTQIDLKHSQIQRKLSTMTALFVIVMFTAPFRLVSNDWINDKNLFVFRTNWHFGNECDFISSHPSKLSKYRFVCSFLQENSILGDKRINFSSELLTKYADFREKYFFSFQRIVFNESAETLRWLIRIRMQFFRQKLPNAQK